jgi:hypothetical protein
MWPESLERKLAPKDLAYPNEVSLHPVPFRRRQLRGGGVPDV